MPKLKNEGPWNQMIISIQSTITDWSQAVIFFFNFPDIFPFKFKLNASSYETTC